MLDRMEMQANRKTEQIFPEKVEIYEKSMAYAKENGIQLLFFYDKNGITNWRFLDQAAESTLQQKLDTCVGIEKMEPEEKPLEAIVSKCRATLLEPLAKSAVNISETIFHMVK